MYIPNVSFCLRKHLEINIFPLLLNLEALKDQDLKLINVPTVEIINSIKSQIRPTDKPFPMKPPIRWTVKESNS